MVNRMWLDSYLLQPIQFNTCICYVKPQKLNQGSINALGNQAIKAYVLESDVTNSQNRVTRILNSSRFK